MLIGIPKETKPFEYRVALTPYGARQLIRQGHQVIVQRGAGDAAGHHDAEYQRAGAVVASLAGEVYERAEMIVKVKEPQPEECGMIRSGQIIFAYLHLAACPRVAAALIDSNCIAIAFETITDAAQRLPLLAPMSAIAGKIAVQAGARHLECPGGGKGVLLGGLPGIRRGRVAIVGGGVAGQNAASVAVGMGAEVTILDISISRLEELENRFGVSCSYVAASPDAVAEITSRADLVIGSVLVPGATAPKIITADMTSAMQKGSVIVDIAIDQGGCCETSRPTDLSRPVFAHDDVLHYCVPNIPSSVAHSASGALENAILPYAIRLANKGYRGALTEDKFFRHGLNVYRGRVTHEEIANALNYPYVPAAGFLDRQTNFSAFG
ncbi:MAG: alanine dehydrogenase [Rickettsiales bacterium]